MAGGSERHESPKSSPGSMPQLRKQRPVSPGPSSDMVGYEEDPSTRFARQAKVDGVLRTVAELSVETATRTWGIEDGRKWAGRLAECKKLLDNKKDALVRFQEEEAVSMALSRLGMSGTAALDVVQKLSAKRRLGRKKRARKCASKIGDVLSDIQTLSVTLSIAMSSDSSSHARAALRQSMYPLGDSSVRSSVEGVDVFRSATDVVPAVASPRQEYVCDVEGCNAVFALESNLEQHRRGCALFRRGTTETHDSEEESQHASKDDGGENSGGENSGSEDGSDDDEDGSDDDDDGGSSAASESASQSGETEALDSGSEGSESDDEHSNLGVDLLSQGDVLNFGGEGSMTMGRRQRAVECYEQALRWSQALVGRKRNDPLALSVAGWSHYRLGQLIEDGQTPLDLAASHFPDIEVALAHYELAADCGNTPALASLGRIYHDGARLIDPRPEDALSYFAAATMAQAQAANKREIDTASPSKSTGKASVGLPDSFQIEEQCAVAASLYSLSRCFARGFGTAPDTSRSERLLEDAARCGSADAQNALGTSAYDRGDLAGAAEFFGLAAEQGHAGAMNNLGVCLEQGVSDTREGSAVPSVARAVEFFLQASSLGHPGAQNNLGYHYWQLSRESGTNDRAALREEAIQLLSEAARSGIPDAAFNLGCVILEDDADRTDFEDGEESGQVTYSIEGLKWLEYAVNQGHVPAMLRLAALMLDMRDTASARVLWTQAAMAGDEIAANNLRVLDDEVALFAESGYESSALAD